MSANRSYAFLKSFFLLALVTPSFISASSIDIAETPASLPILSDPVLITDEKDQIDDEVFEVCQSFVRSAPSDPQYGTYLADCLTSASIVGATKSYVLTRRAIYDLLNKRYSDARKYGLEVCSGEHPVRRLDFVIAVRRLAWLEHRQGNLFEAIRLYRLAAEWADDKVKVQCRLEIAALYMELGKGEGADPLKPHEYPVALSKTRTFAKEVFDSETTVAQTQALLGHLLYFESYYFEGDYSRAVNEGRAFRARWEDIERPAELDKTYYYTGLCYLMQSEFLVGNDDEAHSIARSLLSSDIPAEISFPAKDIGLYATCVKLLISGKDSDQSVVDEQVLIYGKMFRDILNDLKDKRKAVSI